MDVPQDNILSANSGVLRGGGAGARGRAGVSLIIHPFISIAYSSLNTCLLKGCQMITRFYVVFIVVVCCLFSFFFSSL